MTSAASTQTICQLASLVKTLPDYRSINSSVKRLEVCGGGYIEYDGSAVASISLLTS